MSFERVAAPEIVEGSREVRESPGESRGGATEADPDEAGRSGWRLWRESAASRLLAVVFPRTWNKAERFSAGAYWLRFGISMDEFQSCVKFPCPVFVSLPSVLFRRQIQE